jgi:hypothetical protein
MRLLFSILPLLPRGKIASLDGGSFNFSKDEDVPESKQDRSVLAIGQGGELGN